MRVTLNWLRDFVDFDLTAQELADKLDLSGTAVESIVHLGAKYDKFVVGEVVAAEPHPNADRLRYCEVDVKDQKLGIVCGAPNVAAGQKVAVALPGAILPSGLQIKTTNLRGVTSEGMICSEIELELGEDAAGIMVLSRDTEVGLPLAAALGLDDWVLELEITPNRPDCMGLIGVAREVAALVGGRLRLPEVNLIESGDSAADKIDVLIEAPDLCPRYSARYVDQVKIGPSPVWLRRRLEAVGIRSINNVVDVTNYVLMETGQPLHAFDYQLLRGSRVVVRRAGSGETLETIDHVVRELTSDTLVIADGERAVALAGVMGGLDSEIHDGTTEVLIEAAYFNPPNIRKNSRALGLISESSLRFERGTDIGGTVFAADRAAELIAATAGGRVWRGAVDNYPEPRPPRKIKVRPDRVNALLGIDLSATQMADILIGLELKVETAGNDLIVEAPTFRVDLEREVDIIEEAARMYGLNNIPAAVIASTDPDRGFAPLPSLARRLRVLMTAAGLNEVVNYSFIGSFELDRLGLPDGHLWSDAVPIANPLSEDQGLLRPSLLPSLLRTTAHNLNRGQKDIQIFEIGNAWRPTDGLPEQRLLLGGVLTGRVRSPSWFEESKVLSDFYHAKGLVELVCRHLKIDDYHLRAAELAVVHPGQTAELLVGDTVVGWFGRLHPRIESAYDISQPVFVFQLALEELLKLSGAQVSLAEIPRFPAVVLDLALVVGEQVPWERLRRLVLETGRPLLKQVELFDIYRGPGVEQGYKSLAFNLTYQASDRTLTDEEVARIQQRLIKRADKELGARLRK